MSLPGLVLHNEWALLKKPLEELDLQLCPLNPADVIPQ